MFSPGTRVVVRYTDNGSLTDALGEVLETTPTHLRIATKRGPVDVPKDAIETGHEIPPAPTRPGKLHEIVSAEDLRKVAAATWSPREIAWLHADNLASELRGEDPKVLSGWLLRSAPATSAVNTSTSNTSTAANSALPISDPGMPTQEALSLAVTWLKERGSTPHILIHTRAHSSELSPASQQVAPLLRGVGYRRISARRIQPPDCKRTPIPHPFGHFDWPRRPTDHGGRGTHRIRDEVGRSLPPGRSPRLAPHWGW